MERMTAGRVWLAIGCAAGLVLGGCSGSPKGGGSDTASALQTAADRIEAGHAQLEETMNSLAAVTSQEGDLSDSYREFSNDLGDLQKRANQVQNTADQISREGDAYMEKWDEDLAAIQNESIQRRSRERQQAIRRELDGIASDYQALAEAFKPLMSDLKDMSAYLKTDLTSAGVNAIKEPAARAQQQASRVLEMASGLEQRFRDLGVALSADGASEG